MKCCICGKEFTGNGNDPWGAAWLDPKTNKVVRLSFKEGDQCCMECNNKYVVVGRMCMLNEKEGNK